MAAAPVPVTVGTAAGAACQSRALRAHLADLSNGRAYPGLQPGAEGAALFPVSSPQPREELDLHWSTFLGVDLFSFEAWVSCS